ncbi:hypothetical protein QE152_g31097 [Popillia japonica]|uniref:Uncharacterized protein n=1 Tax=Popillia japonica TaxID=7064 RepID=A0AAW1JCD3_POPJA
MWPWINETIKRSNIQLKALYALLQTAEIMKLCNVRKKEYRKLITKEKKAYYANRLHSSKNKTKFVWDIVRKVTNKTKLAAPLTLIINEREITSPIEVANNSGNHFSRNVQ